MLGAGVSLKGIVQVWLPLHASGLHAMKCRGQLSLSLSRVGLCLGLNPSHTQIYAKQGSEAEAKVWYKPIWAMQERYFVHVHVFFLGCYQRVPRA